MSFFRFATVTLAAVTMTMVAVGPALGQFRKGIGRGTVDVVLNRKRPPKVVILGTAIKVEVTSQTGGRDQIAQRFATTLETQLLSNDPRLKPEPARPDTVIACAINRLDTSQTAGARQVTVSRQVGTKRVYNAKKKIYEDQPNYQLVNETQHFTTVKGDIAVSIQVRDRKSGATIDSQTFTPAYQQEFPAGTPPLDTNSVEQALLERTAGLAVQRLTPTREPIKVMLARPNDQIDDLNKLGEAGLWARMLEQLELVKPLSNPEKEAYRLYNLGVANEALAYSSEGIETSRKLLELASSYYGKAIELMPDEKYFRDPQARIADGIAAYAELDRQQAIIAADAAKAPVVADTAAGDATGSRDLTSSPGGPAGAMSNHHVVALVSSGLDDENLLASIKDAKLVSFDLSPEGLQQLLKAKVSNRIIAAMRVRQNAATRSGSRPTAKPPATGRGVGRGSGTSPIE
jgi:hypothetical protein